MPEIDFDSFNRKRADQFLIDYLAAGPPRLTWLRERTGLQLTPGRQALLDFWGWAVNWHDNGGCEEPDDQPMPLWWDWDPARDPYTYAEVVLIDAGAYLIAESLMVVAPYFSWQVERDRRDVNEHQPVLAGGPIPLNPRAGLAIRVHHLNLGRSGDTSDYVIAARDPKILAAGLDTVAT